MTDAQIDTWIKTTRHEVMYGDESRVDESPLAVGIQ